MAARKRKTAEKGEAAPVQSGGGEQAEQVSGLLTGLQGIVEQLQEIISRLEGIVARLVGAPGGLGAGEPLPGGPQQRQPGGEREGRERGGAEAGREGGQQRALVPEVVAQLQGVVDKVLGAPGKQPPPEQTAGVLDQLRRIVEQLERAPGRESD